MENTQHTTATRPGGKRDLQIPIVFLIALAVRLAYFLTVRAEPYYQVPLLDSGWYHRSALEILRDGFWGGTVFFRAPLYSYFLALVYRLFGENPAAPKVLQMVLGAGTCALLTAAARRVFNRPTAFASGIIAALYPTLIFFDGELLATGLETFLGVLLLFLLLRADGESRPLGWAAGLVLGFAAITRPTILLFGAGLAIWMLLDRTRRRIPLLALLAGAAIVIAPVTVRNAVVGRDFVPIASQGGINFYMGNNPGADGKSAILPGWSGEARDWTTFEDDTRRMAEADLGRPLSPSQESAFWTRKALSFLAADPLQSAGLFARKAYFLLDGFEIPNNKNLYFFKRYSPVLNVLLWRWGVSFPTGLLIPLAVAGLLFSSTRPRPFLVFYLFLLCQSLAILAFFVCARFRAPLLPALIPFAVWGAAGLVRRLRFGPRPAGVVVLLVTAAFLVLSNSAFFGVTGAAAWQDYYDLGLVYAERGDHTAARRAFEQALQMDGDEPVVLYNLGLVEMDSGNLDMARARFAATLAIDPGMIAARNNLGICLGRLGRLDEAEREFRKILEIDPDHPEARANLRQVERLREAGP